MKPIDKVISQTPNDVMIFRSFWDVIVKLSQLPDWKPTLLNFNGHVLFSTATTATAAPLLLPPVENIQKQQELLKLGSQLMKRKAKAVTR